MYVTLVNVHVKPEHVADFIESIRMNHEDSVREPGNLRFDILQSVDDQTRFVVYEAYEDEASAKAHKPVFSPAPAAVAPTVIPSSVPASPAATAVTICAWSAHDRRASWVDW